MSYFIAKIVTEPANAFDDFYPLASRMALLAPFSGILCIWLNIKGVNKENL